jgi:predicted phage terminase large subunit-like protein
MEYPELKRAVREQYARFRPSVVLIEDKASGTQLIQELIAEGLYAITRYQPQSDKVMRMHAQTAMIENGFVHLPDAAPWLAQYLHQITTFPNGRRDDQADSTAQMLDWFKRGAEPSSNAGIFELYRQRAEELRRGEPRPGRLVRLRAPAGVGAVQLFREPIGTCQPMARSRCRNRTPRRYCGRPGSWQAFAVRRGRKGFRTTSRAWSPITKRSINQHPARGGCFRRACRRSGRRCPSLRPPRRARASPLRSAVC